MFGPKTALGIDISNGRINLALLIKDKNSVKLLETASGPVPDGAIRNGSIQDPTVLAKAIKELEAGNKMRAKHVALSLVADPMLMQVLDLPKNVSGDVRRFVRNEVKHYAILPIKKVAIDFCGIRSSAKASDRRVFVVATDSQKLTEAAKALSGEGLNIEAIEPAPLAYFRACYAKKIGERFERNLLFVMANENVLTLCLFGNQTLYFVRTKRLRADVLQSDKYFEVLAEEIYAVIQFYEVEVLDKRGKWDVTLVTNICSESAKEKMDSLVTNVEDLELEVRSLEDAYLDTPVADTEYDDKPSAVAVGLAMKLLDCPSCGLNINLLPSEVTEIKSAKRQTLVIANVAAAVLFLMILSVGFFNVRAKGVNRKIKRRAQTQLGQRTRTLLNKQALLNEKIENISENIKKMNAILSTSSFLKWGQVLDDIRLATPETVQITNLFSKDNSVMFLDGRALSYEAVELFVDMLDASKHIESASLTGTKKDSRSDGVVMYSIDCSLIQ